MWNHLPNDKVSSLNYTNFKISNSHYIPIYTVSQPRRLGKTSSTLTLYLQYCTKTFYMISLCFWIQLHHVPFIRQIFKEKNF